MAFAAGNVLARGASASDELWRDAPGWRDSPPPRRWRVYALALVTLSIPFFLRAFWALAAPPVGWGFLAALFVTLVVANVCVLELPPYRFLHLATGFVLFGGFFVAGPAVLALLALSMKPSELLRAVWTPPFVDPDRRPPLGGRPEEYAVPAAASAIVLGGVDALLAPIGFSYPFRPAGAGSDALFFFLLATSYGTWVLLTEIGVCLRFGAVNVLGTRRARGDLLVYVLTTFIGGPFVLAIVHVYGPDLLRTLFALVWMLWGFGVYAVAAIQVRRQLRIERLAMAIAKQERLAALGRLASVIAHQTRHHLGILNMSAYVLGETLAKESLSPPARDTIGRELEAIARTRNELEQLLAQELRGSGGEESFGVKELARECGADLARLAGGRGVTVRVQGEDARIRGDRLRLKQALTNVLRNAIEVSPPASEVDVEIDADGTDVSVGVRDRGPGLSESARKHLFEPLFTEKSDGLGMGLYVARAIVEAHGGEIALVSGDSGTRAEIRLGRLDRRLPEES